MADLTPDEIARLQREHASMTVLLHEYLECKRAFYAGAHALFSMLVTNVDENLEEPTDREMALMEDVSEELRLFGVSGGRG